MSQGSIDDLEDRKTRINQTPNQQEMRKNTDHSKSKVETTKQKH